MTGPKKSSVVSLDGRGRPIVSVYLAFPWWVFRDARGTSRAWPCDSLEVSSISLDLVISPFSLASSSS